MNRKSIIADPNHFVHSIVASRDFAREQKREQVPGERTRTAVEIGALACEADSKTAQGYDTKESAVFKLIGHISSFADAQAQRNHLRELEAKGVPVSYAQKEPYLREVIRFNHAAKELVNLDQNVKFDELTAFVANMYASQHVFELNKLDPEDRRDKVAWLEHEASIVLNGMRHELAYEQAIGVLMAKGYDIDYEDTTEDDELEGADYFVTLNGVRRKVDVKGNPNAIKQAHHVWSHARYRRQPNGVMIDDFNNGFRISTQLAEQNADAVLNDLLVVPEAEVA